MIIFENKGELDIRAIKTFGVNSKDDKESAIGYFGTGLKYAIAILLRNGHDISIYTGGVKYDFGVNRSKIRHDEFDIVTMNGEELGFTTELGKNWEMWQAFRELNSNTLDEKGTAYKGIGCVPQNDRTYVTVTGLDFEKLWGDRDHYFLNYNNFKALHEHDEVSVYPKTPVHVLVMPFCRVWVRSPQVYAGMIFQNLD
jgi:hypothetical protein